MVTIENLRFKYPRSNFVLEIPNLEIAAGEKVAFVGPSGCGKTTLLNLISGITSPDSGTVTTAGQIVSSMSDAKRRDFRISNIGMVFQQFELVQYLDLIGNILLPFSINGSIQTTDAVTQTAKRLAAETGLGDKFNRLPSQLSQGEQQRCAICRALIVEPKLILADEPTGNLDAGNKQSVMELMFDQADRNGQTLVVVTHDTSILSGMDRTIDFTDFHRESVATEKGIQ